MKQKVILGIDAGTSSVKVCAFSLDGKPIAKQSLPVSIDTSQKGRAEINPEDYWYAMRSAIKTLLQEGDYHVLSIGFSTTCPCITCMDDKYNSLGNSITYLDNRATKELALYLDNFDQNETTYFQRVGNRASISTCYSSSIAWIKNHEPERWKNTKYIGMLNSFLAAKLVGSSAIDTTQASYSGIFTLSRPSGWDDELLALADIPKNKLLEVVSPTHRVGGVKKSIAEFLGLLEGTPVAIGSGDTAAASFGLGFRETNQAFDSVGTSGVLSFVLDEPRFNPIFMNRCHIYPNRWLAHGATSLMGGSLDWLIKNIFVEFSSPGDLDEITPKLERGANGVVFLPYLAGERSPIWDPRAKGVWYGMDLATTRYDLIEAVFESGAFALKQILDHARTALGTNIESILAVGNGTKSKYWSQLKADLFGVPYYTTDFTDFSAYGAALMGACAAGIFAGPEAEDIPTLQISKIEYEPQYLEGKLTKNFQTYKKLYPCLKKLMTET